MATPVQGRDLSETCSVRGYRFGYEAAINLAKCEALKQGAYSVVQTSKGTQIKYEWEKFIPLVDSPARLSIIIDADKMVEEGGYVSSLESNLLLLRKEAEIILETSQ